MLQNSNDKNNDLFVISGKHFLLLFGVLFTLLFSTSAFLYSEQIYIYMLRKYYVPSIEKEFGFTGGVATVKYKDQEQNFFVIKSIEPGGLLEEAGFKSGDAPFYSFCRFGLIGKSNEAIFYNSLTNVKDGDFFSLNVANIEDHNKNPKTKNTFNFDTREVEFQIIEEVELISCFE